MHFEFIPVFYPPISPPLFPPPISPSSCFKQCKVNNLVDVSCSALSYIPCDQIPTPCISNCTGCCLYNPPMSPNPPSHPVPIAPPNPQSPPPNVPCLIEGNVCKSGICGNCYFWIDHFSNQLNASTTLSTLFVQHFLFECLCFLSPSPPPLPNNPPPGPPAIPYLVDLYEHKNIPVNQLITIILLSISILSISLLIMCLCFNIYARKKTALDNYPVI